MLVLLQQWTKIRAPAAVVLHVPCACLSLTAAPLDEIVLLVQFYTCAGSKGNVSLRCARKRSSSSSKQQQGSL